MAAKDEPELKAKPLHSLHFTVNHVPDWGNLLLFGFQQMMLCISGLLVVPFLLSNFACAGSATIQLRVRLIAVSFVSSGIATVLQTTFGLRLCILHGPSFAFVPPLIAFAALPENNCSATLDTYVPPELWTQRILVVNSAHSSMKGCECNIYNNSTAYLTTNYGRCAMQGSLLISVITLILMGITGLVAVVGKMIGPITIVPLLLMLVLGFVPELHDKMSLHWISIVEFGILIALAVFLENVYVPFPYYSLSMSKWITTKARIFGLFPYLISIALAWFICFLLTVTGLEPEGGEARTDRNQTSHILSQSPWFQLPYPGQFGVPQASIGLTFAFVASCLTCVMESIGDYQTCARVSHQNRPPSSAINRAIIIEGVGSAIAALMGMGAGVTTYAENIAAMHVTKVVSRSTMQMAGVLLIVAGLFTKCAAMLATIPDAVVGGILAMGMAMIIGVAFSNLQSVDLRMSRNLTIMGLAVLLGTLIPLHFQKYPVRTGTKSLDDCLNMWLQIRMLIGGSVAFVLDNTVPGATREQRGFRDEKFDGQGASPEEDGYAPPPFMRRLLLRFPTICRLPFLPSVRSLHVLSGSTKLATTLA